MSNNKTHLMVIFSEAEQDNNCCVLVNPRRQDVHWNNDFTAWRAIDLAWWDDQSYIDYQCRDNYPDYQDELEERDSTFIEAIKEIAEPYQDDGLPF